MKHVVRIMFILGVFLTGLFAGAVVTNRTEVSEFTPTCRPSSPETLGNQPAVLFWGNSLAFDGDWPLDGFASVNCAVQGMTAQTAALRTTALPEMNVAAVVLVLGTVELVRDIADPATFRAALDAITADLAQKYPDADIIAFGIPRNETAKDVWAYENQQHLDALNDVLGQIPDVAFLDTTQILAGLPVGSETYDGVHLTRQSYLLLNTAIQNALRPSEQ